MSVRDHRIAETLSWRDLHFGARQLISAHFPWLADGPRRAESSFVKGARPVAAIPMYQSQDKARTDHIFPQDPHHCLLIFKKIGLHAERGWP
jgi:hypothetical protein